MHVLQEVAEDKLNTAGTDGMGLACAFSLCLPRRPCPTQVSRWIWRRLLACIWLPASFMDYKQNATARSSSNVIAVPGCFTFQGFDEIAIVF